MSARQKRTQPVSATWQVKNSKCIEMVLESLELNGHVPG